MEMGFSLLLLGSFFVAVSMQDISSRSSTSIFVHSHCKTSAKAMAQKTVSSILQCQHFCTAKERCQSFAVGSGPGGLTRCNLYSGNDHSCDAEQDWAIYSLTRISTIVSKKEQQEGLCSTSRNIVSFSFPNSSVENSITFGIKAATDLTSFTVTLWIRIQKIGIFGSPVFVYRANNSSHCHDIEIILMGTAISITVNNAKAVIMFFKPQLNTFIHIAITWSLPNARIRVFVDGVVKSTQQILNHHASKGNGNAVIGVTYKRESGASRSNACILDSKYTFKGEIRQIYMWNEELSADSIANVTRSDLQCSGRILNWDSPTRRINGAIVQKGFKVV